MYGAKLNRKSLWTNDECMPSIRRLPKQPEWKVIPWWRDKFAETRGQLDIFISRISNWVSHICLCTLWIFDASRLYDIQYLDINKVTPPFVTECCIISSTGYDHVSKFFLVFFFVRYPSMCLDTVNQCRWYYPGICKLFDVSNKTTWEEW